MTISTRENTPEWRWFSGFEKRTNASISRQARDSLRRMLEEPDQSVTIEGLARTLKARMLEIECRDLEILELRHALGLHSDGINPKCPACLEGGV